MADTPLDPLADLVALADSPDLEARIVAHLSARLMAGEMYTSVGATLLTLNPFRALASNAPAAMAAFRRCGGVSMLLPPHLFKATAAAYEASARAPQAIVITGESGAGKTENARLITAFLASYSSAHANIVATRIQRANLLLEAFGNAATARNANSSRFAKHTSILLTPAGVVAGGVLATFLLDRSKVCARDDDAPYHVVKFLAAAPDDVRAPLRLPAAAAAAPGDAASFRGVLLCAKELGFADADVHALLAAVAAGRHLLNLEFDDEGGALRAVPGAALDALAAILGAPPDAVAASLTSRDLIVRGVAVSHHHSAQEACVARDSAAKALYSAAFDAAVALVNAAIAPAAGTVVSRVIHLIDVYGFEGDASAGNFSATQSTAQLVASARSPFGPWTRRGLVCAPTGAPPGWQQGWSARRCDSGRALVVGGRSVTVLWDADGSRYGRGAGLSVLLEGALAAHSADAQGELREPLG
jgi:myosin-5